MKVDIYFHSQLRHLSASAPSVHLLQVEQLQQQLSARHRNNIIVNKETPCVCVQLHTACNTTLDHVAGPEGH